MKSKGRMKFWDISLPITPGLPVWPGDPPIKLERYRAISKGDSTNISRLSGGVHTGTHVDAPLHVIEGGLSVERLLLEVLIGQARVVELLDVPAITPEDLEALKIPSGTERLLLKTSNSALWAEPHHRFYPDFVALTPESARWLVQKGIRLVGIDYLSVQKFHDSEPLTHRLLLGAGVVILEGLNLQSVPPGSYQLICLPLLLVGSDGAPARAVLLG